MTRSRGAAATTTSPATGPQASVLRVDGGDGDDEIIAFGRAEVDGGSGDDHLWGNTDGRYVCGLGRDRAEPDEETLVAADCERIGTWLFDFAPLRGTLLSVRATGFPREEMCGADVLLRAGGRTLARAVARVPNRRSRRLRLTPRAPLPPVVTVAVGSLRCDRGLPRFNREVGRELFRLATGARQP